MLLWRNWELIDPNIHFSPGIGTTAKPLKSYWLRLQESDPTSLIYSQWEQPPCCSQSLLQNKAAGVEVMVHTISLFLFVLWWWITKKCLLLESQLHWTWPALEAYCFMSFTNSRQHTRLMEHISRLSLSILAVGIKCPHATCDEYGHRQLAVRPTRKNKKINQVLQGQMHNLLYIQTVINSLGLHCNIIKEVQQIK